MTNLVASCCPSKFCSPSHKADLTPLASLRTAPDKQGLHSRSRTAKHYSRTRTSTYSTNPFLALAQLFFLLPNASSRVVPEARTKTNTLGPFPRRPRQRLLILFSFFLIKQRGLVVPYLVYHAILFLHWYVIARAFWRALDQIVA
jgi:hypothetical protein